MKIIKTPFLILILFYFISLSVFADELNAIENTIQSQIKYSEDNSNSETKITNSKIIGFLPGWKTPPDINDIKNAGYTHIIVAFAVFSLSNPGEVVPVFDTVSKEYIKSLQNLGIKILVSIGGASSSLPNTTVNFHQALMATGTKDEFTQNFVRSVESLINTYGFQGVDFDIESGLTGEGDFSNPTGDIAVLAKIINILYSHNNSLLITLTPQIANVTATSGFDAVWGNYASLIMQTHGSLEWVGIQVYNAGCAFGINLVCYDPNNTNSPDASVAFATDLLENWPTKDNSGRATGFQPYVSYLKPSQIVLGFPAANIEGVSDGSPPAVISTIKRAIQCLRDGQQSPNSCDTYIPPRIYPDIGGVFEWEITYDANNNFKFAIDLFNCVINGNCK